MCYSQSVTKIVGLSIVKKRKYGKVEKIEIFFSFFSRTVFGFHARDFSFFFTYSCWVFTHGFFKEIFTQGIGLHAHFSEKISRTELVFTHTFYKKIHVRVALFHAQKKTLVGGLEIRSGIGREYFTGRPKSIWRVNWI